ncbi:DUF4190 domain-containing protein [Micromonospora citrea]|uniref:DUF4190 domain-containing protein n=1 Tax=Micromonospora citrea TaxID=47855 RepID=UPI003C4A10B7
MTYPPPPGGGWSSPSGDPTMPVSGQPIPVQPTGKDPYAPADPYAAVPPQAAPVDPYAPHGYPPPTGYPGYGYPPAPQTNGLAIAAMVVSILGALGLCGYGLGGWIGLIGAILGHVSRKQIREKGEGGEGFATAGIIVGWISTVIAFLATIAIVVLVVWAANQDSSTYDSTTY